jgi:hypothetical protein
MDVDFLVSLANQSTGVILTFAGLYLFKVVVNDIKHDVEDIKSALTKMIEVLERMDRRNERGN